MLDDLVCGDAGEWIDVEGAEAFVLGRGGLGGKKGAVEGESYGERGDEQAMEHGQSFRRWKCAKSGAFAPDFVQAIH